MPSETDTADKYTNPITGSFRVLEGYRTLLEHALEQYGTLEADDRQTVTEDLEVDRGLIFSRVSNPKPGVEVSCLMNELQLPNKLEEIVDRELGGNSFYDHQERAIRGIIRGQRDDEDAVPHTVVATGTGSGKTESFLVPVMNTCLASDAPGIKALLVYPMNALANDQLGRIAKWTKGTDITFGTYVGSTPNSKEWVDGDLENMRKHDGHLVTRQEMRDNPPDILLTNYIMLDYMLTRDREAAMFEQSADSLTYLVLDEIHTYRGTKAAHLMHLLRRLEQRANRDLVKIATSATLLSDSDDQHDAYMKVRSDDDPEEMLRSFIGPLLGINDFNYIALESADTHSDAPSPSSNGLPSDALLEAGAHLDWLFGTDKTEQASRLEILTGLTLPVPRALDIKIGSLYDRLDNDPFVEVLRSAMGRQARSFQELVQLLRTTYDLGPSHNAESITKAYLSAIAYLNHRMSGADASKEPLLDFRMHLFLRDIDGYLKRCLRCDQFHAGRQDLCPECGHPLFVVYREDISACIARVVGKKLTYELRPSTDEEEKSVYVLLKKVEDGVDTKDAQANADRPGNASILSIDALDFLGESAEIAYDPDGAFQLEWLDVKDSEAVYKNHVVPLEDPNKDYDYLSRLARALLTYDSPRTEDRGKGKLLGFVDSREHVSRYGMGLRDEFADTFLRGNLQRESPEDLTLVNAARLVVRWQESDEGGGKQEQDLYAEGPIWLGRLIGQTPANGQPDYLSFDDKHDLSDLPNPDLARTILKEFFVGKRLIDRGPFDQKQFSINDEQEAYYQFYSNHTEGPPEDTNFITLQKHAAVRRKGAFIKENGNSRHPNYAGYAVTDDGRVFGDLVDEHGLESVQQVLIDLEKKGILCKRPVPGSDKEHYYLRPKYIRLHPDRLLPDPTQEGVSTFGLPTNPEDIHFRTADSHSSERDSVDRTRIESRFDSGTLDVLMATPTLEMGVDIGNLNTVLMMGVPPMPSNYAQRAGRAGRKKDQQALIVTLCASHRPHDMFYFLNPSGMVNGYITPPSFNKDAPAVAKKHLNAWMLEKFAGSRGTLDRYIGRLDYQVDRRRSEAVQLFGDTEGFDVIAYLDGPFQKKLKEAFQKSTEKRSVQQALYKTGFFPDYTFRKDQIPLIRRDELEQASDKTPDTLQDLALSDRSPELAYYKFAPERTVYIGGRVYKVASEGSYERHIIGDKEARSYRYFVVDPEERYASRYAQRQVYDRVEIFADDDAEDHPPHVRGLPANDNASPFTIAYHPACTIGFRNDGLLEYGETTSFTEVQDNGTRTPFSVGYQFEREALRISIDAALCSDPSLEISLAFALDRAIQGTFQLDEGEMRMLVHPESLESEEEVVATPAKDDREYRHILFYDHSGNGNVPFEDIYEALTDSATLAKVQSVIEGCDCDNGCYRCMRSFSTQYHAESVRKEKGLDMLAYLCGEEDFPSSPLPYSTSQHTPDLTLTLASNGKQTFKVTSDASEKDYEGTYLSEEIGHNPAAFDLINEAILQEWTPNMDHLRIESPIKSIVDAINKHNVRKGKREFLRLLFTLIRFHSVEAKKI